MGRTVLVLGVGNPLAGDDGVGVRAVETLAGSDDLPEGVRILDAGVIGLDLLAWVEPGEPVVILDAVRGGGAPGALYRLPLEDVPGPSRPPVSVHDIGVAHTLQAARLLGRPLHGTLLGVEPARVAAFTTDLSAPVAAALPALRAAAIREARILLAGG